MTTIHFKNFKCPACKRVHISGMDFVQYPFNQHVAIETGPQESIEYHYYSFCCNKKKKISLRFDTIVESIPQFSH